MNAPMVTVSTFKRLKKASPSFKTAFMHKKIISAIREMCILMGIPQTVAILYEDLNMQGTIADHPPAGKLDNCPLHVQYLRND